MAGGRAQLPARQLAQATAQLAGAKAEVVAAKAEAAAAKAELAASKAELASALPELTSSKAELSAVKAELASAHLDLTSAKAELAAVKAEQATTFNRLVTVETRLREQEQAYETLRRSAEAREAAADEEHERLEKVGQQNWACEGGRVAAQILMAQRTPTVLPVCDVSQTLSATVKRLEDQLETAQRCVSAHARIYQRELWLIEL